VHEAGFFANQNAEACVAFFALGFAATKEFGIFQER